MSRKSAHLVFQLVFALADGYGLNMEETTTPVMLSQLEKDPEVRAFISQANENLKAVGFTEHGFRHVGLVSKIARNVLLRMGHDDRTAELAAIAGYLHDIGNVVHREYHALTGAQLARNILVRHEMNWDEIAKVINAIGNHEEERGVSTSPISAALVLADKSDVHRSRLQNPTKAQFDIHDRVNFAAQKSFVRVADDRKTISLELEIDTQLSPVIEYFEIFLSRMVMCRKAAEFLGCRFLLTINGQYLS